MSKKISDLAIPRLSLYYRVLLEYKKTDIVSSEDLANLTGVTAAQVRKDLAHFGQFGIPGKGYQVSELTARIVNILGINRGWNVALVGAGNLGSAFLFYNGFKKQGFNIVCAFDNDIRKIGKTFENVKIYDISKLEKVIAEKDVKIAIVAIPSDFAQKTVDTVVRAGVKAILNFAPVRPQTPDDVQVLNIDLSIELERLTHFLAKEHKDGPFFR